MSAIDKAICEGLVDKVVNEGFSDLDTDQYSALETHQNMLDDEQEIGRRGSSKTGSKLTRNRKSVQGVSKKRKRGNQTDEIE